MSESFKTGYISSLAFYLIEGLVILFLGLKSDNYTWWSMLLFYVLHILVFYGLRNGISKHRLSEKNYQRIISIVFIILNVIFGGVCDSAQVFIYSMFFSTVVMLVFVDESASRFYMKCALAMMVGMGIIVFNFFRGKNTIMDYTVGSIVLLITNGVAISICNFIAFQNRKNREQERGLDDLLKVVEVKCDEARLATRTKSRFLSNMSHEIRTPINAVLGMSEMILRESGEKGIKKYAHDIKSSAESLLSIINDILDSSKIASGKLEIIEVNYDISSFLNDLYNMISVKARDKELELVFDIDGNIPVEYFGDDIRIRQVVVNLLTNAVKYTKEGKVILKLTGKVEGDEATLHFVVRDTGVGIKEEDMDKLFSEFERVEEAKNRNIEGTGLGVSITSSLLGLMGSSLIVKSEYGVGSEFSFDIVQKVINKEPLGDFNERIKNVVSDYTYDISYIAPTARVLVVDDNRTNRNVFCNLLKQTQIKISEAASGFECLDILQKESFDIVFLDHMMPEMDGIETFHEIKNRGLCEHTPIIMLTANAIKGAREQYLSEGFDDFLTKPIRPEKLDKMIIDYLPKDIVEIGEMVLNETVYDDNKDKLEDLDEFDFEYARSLLLSEELLKSTLENYYKSMDSVKSKLSNLYDGIFEKTSEVNDEIIKEYKIEVHALKSTSANVGALLISKVARILEVASANGEITKIKALNPILMEELDKHKERLGTVFNKDIDKKVMQDVKELIPYLDMLQNSLENEDFGTTDLVMLEVQKYVYNDDIQKSIDLLADQILNLETEEAKCTVCEIREIINK